MIAGLKFPALPAGKYTTAPIYLEPIMGSGERIAVAAYAVGKDDFRVEGVLRSEVLECLYGSRSGQFSGLISMITDSLKKHLAGGGTPDNWSAPVSGVSLGAPTATGADDAAHAISMTVRMHASLGYLSATAEDEEEAPAGRRDNILRAWVDDIRAQALAQSPMLKGYFNVPVTLAKGDNARIGFLHQRYAAHFGMMSTVGNQHTTRRKDAKSKLWDLQNLDVPHRELILAVPRADDPWMADKTVSARILGTIESLGIEAEKSGMTVVPTTSAQDAAAHLMKMAA